MSAQKDSSYGEWQDISTAPKGPLDKHDYGPTILLYVDDRVGVGFWDKDFDNFYVECPSEPLGAPTHWMPTPKPPSASHD